MAGWIHDFDITRPVQYEPAQGNHRARGYIPPGDPGYPKDHSHRIQDPTDQPYVDIVSRFYPGLFTPALLANQPGDHRPILFVEYAHSMGNSTGNLAELWNEFRTLPRIIGGCIWDFKDQGILKTDSLGKQFYAYGGDFSKKFNDGDFCINGIVASDGRPKPAMYECKKVFQPVVTSLLDSQKGTLQIKNRHASNSLAGYIPRISILDNGVLVQSEKLPPITLSAQSDTVINIGEYIPKKQPGHEFLLNVDFELAEKTAWAPAGFVIASNQHSLSEWPPPAVKKSPRGKTNLLETDSEWTVNGEGFDIVFSKETGALISIRKNGKEYLTEPLLPHFTRALTDNERRGWKPQEKMKQWYQAKPLLDQLSATTDEQGLAHINTRYTMLDDSVKISIEYMVTREGIVKVNFEMHADPALPNLPKVGMQTGISHDLEQITWYGKGPYENYPDRRTGSNAGIYTKDLDAFIEPYVYPQENGNRTDVRWMFLENSKGSGLLVVADSLMNMSAWPYTEKNLEKATHTNELVDPGFITLNIDLAQMGVGGNDSWSDVAAPLSMYQVPSGTYHYSYSLTVLETGKKSLPDLVEKIRY
jgi:beta-galactosidase